MSKRSYDQARSVVLDAGHDLRNAIEEYLNEEDLLAFRRKLVSIVSNLETLNATQAGVGRA